VNRGDSVTHVKDLIKKEYSADSANTKAVFLFGHVPVPYSGDTAADGHYGEHQGAWPCDGYYADMDGIWTDKSVNMTIASDPRNRNIPGDGTCLAACLLAAQRLSRANSNCSGTI
jgi:hypothetical protein